MTASSSTKSTRGETAQPPGTKAARRTRSFCWEEEEEGNDEGGGRDEGEGRDVSVGGIVGVDAGGPVVSTRGGTISTSSSSSFPPSPKGPKVSDAAAVGSYIKFPRTCEAFALEPPLDPFVLKLQLPSFTNLFRGVK